MTDFLDILARLDAVIGGLNNSGKKPAKILDSSLSGVVSSRYKNPAIRRNPQHFPDFP